MSKKKALLVDDSKSARFFLRNMLQKSDIKVDMVESGEAALDFLKQKENQPDVIFMDHLMPGIDGFETTQAIKKDPATSGIPVVMCTSNEGTEYAAQAKSIGAFDILNKPPTENRLKTILDELETAKAETPAATAVPGLSRGDIETIVVERAQELISDALERLREELKNQIVSQATEAAKAVVAEREGGIKDELLAASKETSLALSRDTAAEVLESRMDDIVGRASKAVDENIQTLRGQWSGERESLLREAKEGAAKAAESAALSTQKSISDSAALFAQESAKQTAEQVVRETLSEASKGLGSAASSAQAQAKIYALAAGGVGVLAALIVHFLG